MSSIDSFRASNGLFTIDTEVPDPSWDDLVAYFDSIDFKPEYGESYKLDKYDWLVAALLGILGGVADVVIGKPGGYSEPKMKWAKAYDFKKSPIDYQGDLGAPVGDHRLYSNGHDLCRYGQTVKEVCQGQYSGWLPKGGESSAFIGDFPSLDPTQAMLHIAVHLYKDFWTSRSLPIPGTSYLPGIFEDKVPDIIRDSYRDGLNLRTLTGQAVSVAICEIGVRVHLYARKHFSENYEFAESKKTRMLMISHSIALAINIGKVVITKNPVYLNKFQIIALLKSVVKFAAERLDIIYNRVKIVGEYASATRVALGHNAGLIVLLGEIHSSYNDIKFDLDDIIKCNQMIEESNAVVVQEREHLIDEYQNLNDLLNKAKSIIGEKNGDENE